MENPLSPNTVLNTRSGQIDLNRPLKEDIHIEDIAFGLSKLCRFNGQCRRFYSVAEHSIAVSAWLAKRRLSDRNIIMHGLMHDAHEAYIGDITTPMKNALGPRAAARIKNISDRLDTVIFDALDISPPPPALVNMLRLADESVLTTELNELFKPGPLVTLTSGEAADMFLEHFYDLCHG